MRASNPDELEKFVNNEIAHGWHVTGGLAVVFMPAREILHPSKTILLQAMIHESKQ